MKIKKELETRQDFTGEFLPTENTTVYLNCDQIDEDGLIQDKAIAKDKVSVLSDGTPQGVRDRWFQEFRGTNLEMKELDSNFYYPSNLPNVIDVDVLDHESKAVDFLNGAAQYDPGNIDAPTSNNRAFYAIFKLREQDFDATGYEKLIVGNYYGYNVTLLDGVLYGNIYQEDVKYWAGSLGTAAADKWYMVILTNQTDAARFYLNGELKQSFSTAAIGDIYWSYQAMHFAWFENDIKTRCHPIIKSWGFYSKYVTNQEAKTFFNNFARSYPVSPENTAYNFTGTWTQTYDRSKYYMYYTNTTSDTGATFSMTFYGNWLEIICWVDPSYGTFDVYIDDVYKDTVDLSIFGTGLWRVSSATDLKSGVQHTVRIEHVSGTINIERFYINTDNYVEPPTTNEKLLRPDYDEKYYMTKEQLPTGYYRQLIEEYNEEFIVQQKFFDGNDTDVTLVAGAVYVESNDFLDIPKNVLDVSGGLAAKAYVGTAPASSGDSMTLICWFKVDEIDLLDDLAKAILTQRTITEDGYHIGIYEKSIYMRGLHTDGVQAFNYFHNVELEPNRWYMATIAHDNTDYTLMLDNEIIDSGTLNGGRPAYEVNAFRAGTALADDRWAFTGQIGGFSLYSVYLNDYEINDIFQQCRLTKNALPVDAEVETTGNWNYKLMDDDTESKVLESDTNGDIYELTVYAYTLNLYGMRNTDGGECDIYINDILQTSVDQNYTSPDRELMYAYSGTDRELITLKIVNTSSAGEYVRLLEMYINFGDNILFDQSGNENNARLYNYTFNKEDLLKFGDKTYSYNLKSDQVDSQKPYIKLNPFTTAGNRVLFSIKFKPDFCSVDLKENVFFDNINTSEGNNGLLNVLYNQKRGGLTEDITISSNFINLVCSIPVNLYGTSWHTLFILIDSVARTVRAVCVDTTNRILVFDETDNFITAQNMAQTNLNQFYVGKNGDDTKFNWARIDEIIVENDTDFDNSTNKFEDYYFYNSLGNGGSLELTNHVYAGYTDKLQLKKINPLQYANTGKYSTGTVKLSSQFENYGRVILDKTVLGGTSIENIETRTSDNGYDLEAVWSDWQPVSEIGMIRNENAQYIEMRADLNSSLDQLTSPQINKITFQEYDNGLFENKKDSLPVIYNSDGTVKAIIHDAYNLYEIAELNGVQYIQFDIPHDSPKAQHIEKEDFVRLTDEFFIIRNISKNRIADKLIFSVYAEALFYNLSHKPPLKAKNFLNATVKELFDYILHGTGWIFGSSDIDIVRDYSVEIGSKTLEHLRNIQGIFGGDLVFDNYLQTVSLYEQHGSDTGIIFNYGTNLNEVSQTIDTTDYVNRLYAYGNNNITIATVNNGKDYIDLESPGIHGIKSATVTQAYFKTPAQLLEFIQLKAAEYNTPTITYQMDVKDLGGSIDIDNIGIGDRVFVNDSQLGVSFYARIEKITYNILVPNLSKIVLTNKIRELGDDISLFEKERTKLEKINVSRFSELFLWYNQNVTPGTGWVDGSNIVTADTPAVGITGTVEVPEGENVIYIRALPDNTSSIIGVLYQDNTIKIEEISSTFYRIDN